MPSRFLYVIQTGFAVAAGTFVFSISQALATSPSTPGPYRCYHGYVPDAKDGRHFPIRGGGTLSVNGFTIEVQADPNPDAIEACHVTIRSREGQAVFQGGD